MLVKSKPFSMWLPAGVQVLGKGTLSSLALQPEHSEAAGAAGAEQPTQRKKNPGPHYRIKDYGNACNELKKVPHSGRY